jgi:hypothetical protein
MPLLKNTLFRGESTMASVQGNVFVIQSKYLDHITPVKFDSDSLKEQSQTLVVHRSRSNEGAYPWIQFVPKIFR